MPLPHLRLIISLLVVPVLAIALLLVGVPQLGPSTLQESIPQLGGLVGLLYRDQRELKMASAAGKNGVEKLNVLKTPLRIHSLNPLTGYFRDGYCRTSSSDFGHHAVAGVVSDEFLEFSASKGNDLRTIGLKEGCKWCLCTGRWLEAFKAFEAGDIGEKAVPKVVLEATEDSVLEKVKGFGGIGVLERFKAKGNGE